ncbi:MAG: hypothetical protein JWL81_626 [Verrucomicrobiales bacterium]|nr:hypothetical protein [Verrucomicrobiales bacterium]
MSFAHPIVLLALLLLPLLAGLKLWAEVRARKAAARMVSERHLSSLLIPRARQQDWWVLFFELGALACFIIALARPQYGMLEEESGPGGRSLIVAIDTSRSMLTDDLKPSRLVRAQLAATDLIKRLRGDRIGLMPFAGSAFMYAPITPDIDALLESIDSLDAEVIPRGGSNLARPIDLALETFAKAEATGQQVLILFSDGENLEGTTLEAARRAKEKKMTIITIGVGTRTGNLIPDESAPSGVYRDRDGKPVLSKLQREVLMSIADTTDGLYLSLDENGVNDERIDRILEKLKRTAMKGKLTQKPIDRYRWPLGVGLLLLTGGWIAGIVKPHRRQGPPPLPVVPVPPATGSGPGPGSGSVPAVTGMLIAGFIFLTSGAPTAVADVTSPTDRAPASPTGGEPASPSAPEELPVGNPWEFYREGKFEAAQKNFQLRLDPDENNKSRKGGDPVLEFGRGAAAFKNKDYDTAVDAFGQAVLSPQVELRAKAHYNLANSIYERTAEFLKISQRGKKPKITLSFIDGLIRQLENSLENYQQALALEPKQEDFKANHDTTDQLIQKLRKIRQQMADQQKKEGKQKGEGGKEKKKGKKGEGEQEGEGSGPGEGQPGGKGPNGEEEGEAGSKKEGEGEAEKAAREKSNEDKSGEIGEQGNQGEKGDEEGEGKDGKNGDQPDDSGEGGDPGEADEAENEVNSETGFSPAEAKRQLELLSDEDMKVRPRIEQAPERRPLKDW